VEQAIGEKEEVRSNVDQYTNVAIVIPIIISHMPCLSILLELYTTEERACQRFKLILSGPISSQS